MHHQGRHNIMCLIYLTRLWFRVLESPLKLVRCYTDLFVLSCNINVWKFLLLKKIFSPDRVLSRHCHTILDWETNVRGNKKNYLTFPQKIQNKITMKVKVSVTQSAWLFATPWTVTHQAPPSMGFSRQEYWSGLPCPPPKLSYDSAISLLGADSKELQTGTRTDICIPRSRKHYLQ